MMHGKETFSYAYNFRISNWGSSVLIDKKKAGQLVYLAGKLQKRNVSGTKEYYYIPLFLASLSFC